ncbi:hypothetical protein HY793_01460 [Candidatus Desantisbacteria bacterium]|nr:hypothetical protein [Candidatus Desantisbacteria bacterium]
MKATVGFTLIELLLSLVGMAIIMLSIFALFSGGVKNWTTMEPQLTMRQEAMDALYGKAGAKTDGLAATTTAYAAADMKRGMVNNIQSARVLLDGIGLATTTTKYADDMRHGTISSSVIYFIKDDKQYEPGTNTPGTFSPTAPDYDTIICYYAGTETDSSWSLKRDVYAPGTGTTGSITSSSTILRKMGTPERTGTGSYGIFTYYNKSGQAIDPTNIVQSIATENIAYISINIQMDIDSDHDNRYGEDPIDGINNDNDNKIDEDKPMDLSILTKVFPRMLWTYTPQ